MENSDTVRLRGGGRGAYDTAGVPKLKPPPKPDDPRVPKQTQWEEMNRRQRIHEHFNNATPQTDHEIEALNRAISNEEQRRLRWDNNRKVRHSATSMADNMDAALPALSALTISAEPTALKASNTPKSRTKRALTGLQGSLKKPWTKPTESAETDKRKAKRDKKEKKKVLKKEKKEKEQEAKEEKEKEEKGEESKRRERTRGMIGGAHSTIILDQPYNPLSANQSELSANQSDV